MDPLFRQYVPTEPVDIVQIALLWAGLYFAIRLARGTIAWSILRGAILLVSFAIVVTAVVLRVFELRVLEQVLVALGNVAVLALLVVFQPELRRGLLSLGEHRFFAKLRRRAPGCLEELAKAVPRLSRQRHGALFAIERENILHHIATTGVSLDSEARADLLTTIFWPGSPLHDGGVVLRGDRVAAAACIFPLAERREFASAIGTRHRAGLGLSEESDAVVVIVSEETGRVSVAVAGRLLPVDPPEALESVVRPILAGERLPGESGREADEGSEDLPDERNGGSRGGGAGANGDAGGGARGGSPAEARA